MAANFYNEVGWDSETGKPYAETLQKLGVERLVDDMTTEIKKTSRRYILLWAGHLFVKQG